MKQLHDVFVIERNGLGVDAGQILQPPDHGGIIVSQNIQLQQVGINGMVIKMSGDNIAVHIVGRVLDRSKLLNVPANRKNNDSSGVLARGPAHSGAALDDPVDLPALRNNFSHSRKPSSPPEYRWSRP